MKAELEAIKAAMAEEREETQRIIDERDLAEEAVKLLKEELTKAKKALKELQDEAGAAADAADAADGEDD
jgi:predicted nuclease with TOPRIM domain